MEIQEILELIPEEKREGAKIALSDYVKVSSKEDVLSLLDKPGTHFEKARDSLISKTTEKYDQRFKAEKLTSLVEEEIKKRNPAKSEVEIQLESLKSELENERKQAKREKLLAKSLEMAQKKNLPFGADILGRFIADDEESTASNIEAFAGAYLASVEAAVTKVKEQHFGNSGKPGQGRSTEKTIQRAEFDQLAPQAKIETIKAGVTVVE